MSERLGRKAGIDALARRTCGTAWIRPAGDLDRDRVDRLTDEAGRLVDRLRPATLGVDLALVPFVDAAGCRALLTCRSVAHEHGAGFVVRGAAPIVLRVLRAAGVADTIGPGVTAPAPAARVQQLRDLRARSEILCETAREIIARSAGLQHHRPR